MTSVHIHTLGCKVNTFDSRALESQFISGGYTLVEQAKDADVQVINSCSVTANAEKEARYLIRRFERENPSALKIITGCYAQTDSSRLIEMAELDFVVPNEAKDQLLQLVEQGLKLREKGLRADSKLPVGTKAVAENRQSHFKSATTFFDQVNGKAQTRTFLKIQDGCNGFCTYCLIPYARGASSSVPPEQVLAEIKRLVALGTREIVFTGIHIGDYGDDFGDRAAASDASPFIELLKEVFAIPNLDRIRISSLEPMEATPELLDVLWENRDKFCDHFHLPLQSGSDRILKLMRRKYDSAGYQATIEMIRRKFPQANVTADIIPGFPGETPEDFADSVAFVEAAGINGLHVFPYSKRPNTAAMRMPDHLAPEVIKERAARLRTLGKLLAADYSRNFLGQQVEVLWETGRDEQGRIQGKTKNYVSVVAANNVQAEPGHINHVMLKGFVGENIFLGCP
jgi:threonylcarbamoyladenosine tRNA methylthiotransferase MtaB